MTNADRIRTMTDEELAEFITSMDFDCADYCDSFASGCAFNCGKKDRKIALKWLKSEADRRAGENMTKSEVIECLETLNNGLNEAFVNADELSEALQMAMEALEKQIPKKPTPIDYEKYIDVINNAKSLRGAYWCPNCKRVVKSGSFCSNCGQKLDWSDTV